MICRNCGIEFKNKKLRRGYIDQCDSCSEDKVERYVGRRQDKHGDVDIFRSNINYVKRVLNIENKAGPTANLPFLVSMEDPKGE